MNFSIRSIAAAGALALAFASGVAAQAAEAPKREPFHATMDRVFGRGGWRQTSGYRSPAKEEALRRQGAGTVPVGRRSAHSVGSPSAPGAYDAVVPGMSQKDAAAKLRRANAPFTRVVAEPARGAQGPHLHIEVVPGRARSAPAICAGYRGERITMRVVGGRRNPLIDCEARWKAQAEAGSRGGA